MSTPSTWSNLRYRWANQCCQGLGSNRITRRSSGIWWIPTGRLSLANISYKTAKNHIRGWFGRGSMSKMTSSRSSHTVKDPRTRRWTSASRTPRRQSIYVPVLGSTGLNSSSKMAWSHIYSGRHRSRTTMTTLRSSTRVTSSYRTRDRIRRRTSKGNHCKADPRPKLALRPPRRRKTALIRSWTQVRHNSHASSAIRS